METGTGIEIEIETETETKTKTKTAFTPSPPAACGPDFSTVKSPEDDDHDLPSDEDHDHDGDHDQDQDHDHDHDEDQAAVGPTVKAEDLKHKIIKQVDYYFSDENLPTDKYMKGLIKKHKDGFVPVSVIASFRKVRKLSRDYAVIVDALRESSFLVVSPNGKRVKRLNPFQFPEVKDSKLCTVLVENLPEDHSVENIKRMFGGVGKIRNVSLRDPHSGEEPKRGSKAEMLVSSKLHVLVEYETVEAAEKAVATFNNEEDWRNGMHVKLLKQVGKHSQRSKVWREPDSGKSHSAAASHHTSNHNGDKEDHKLSEHHGDATGEEDLEHVCKEKNEQHGRNRGRSRRNKHHVASGLGHGTTAFAHPVEPLKPPPGPKMPDGTRGFTMGRGRPPAPNEGQKME